MQAKESGRHKHRILSVQRSYEMEVSFFNRLILFLQFGGCKQREEVDVYFIVLLNMGRSSKCSVSSGVLMLHISSCRYLG